MNIRLRLRDYLFKVIMSRPGSPNNSLPLWRMLFSRSGAEEHGHALLGLGTAGLEICGPHEVACYFEGSEVKARGFCRRAGALGFKLLALEATPRRNWVQACHELWTPLQAGRLRVVPVLEAGPQSDCGRAAREELLIAPGEAFGTGHHASTRMALELLQQPEIAASPPPSGAGRRQRERRSGDCLRQAVRQPRCGPGL